jgi:hypothetical protein
MNECTIWRSGGLTWVRLRAYGPTFHEIVDDFKAEFDGRRWFDGGQRAWRVDGSVHELRAWALRWFSAREVHVEDDYGGYGYGYGSSRRDYQQRRQQQAHHADQGESRLDQAYRALHLQPTAPDELVTSAHRVLSKIHHPDRGGSHAEMVAINAAVDEIRATRR